jgi:hypothetical protein
MSFWSTTIAAPRWLDTWSSSKAARFLRLSPADPPKHALGLPTRLKPDDAGILTAFWSRNYGGHDWYLDAEVKWVESYLNDPGVIVLGLKGPMEELIATIVSTPLSAGTCKMTNGGFLYPETMRVIEGLCIAKQYRGKGLAGHLIGAMDAYTSAKRPVAHLWLRESAAKPLFSTALRTDTYAMIRTARIPKGLVVTEWPFEDFARRWAASCHEWVLDNETKALPCIVGTQLRSRSGHLDVWRTSSEPQRVVVIANTRRRAIPGDEQIFEVVWCGVVEGERLVPNRGGRGFRPIIEAAGTHYEHALLFASSGYMGGEAHPSWKEAGWSYGRSGIHSWYVYNYMPPAFGSCEIYAIREEI